MSYTLVLEWMPGDLYMSAVTARCTAPTSSYSVVWLPPNKVYQITLYCGSTSLVSFLVGAFRGKAWSYMTAKEYLNQARHLDALINCRLREIDYWRDLSSSVSGSNFEPHYNPNKPTEAPFVRCLEKIDAIQKDVAEKVAYLVCLKETINAAIDRLASREEQLVLRYRYLDNCSWEEISRMLNVSLRTVHRIHGSALQNFSVPD